MIRRNKTKEIRIGNRVIGGTNPILVQSMTNTYTGNIGKTMRQIRKLIRADCEIVRVAVPDIESCKAIALFKKKVHIPIIADIHFDYRLAVRAIEEGADKIRINPGNIGKKANIKKIVVKAKNAGIPLRIGVNAGSLEKELCRKYGGPVPDALVESTLRNVEIVESFGFHDIVISIKSSSVLDTIDATIKVARVMDYPIHLGITESGPIASGTIKSAAGISVLLHRGIGDTIRVSLTGDPVSEVVVGYGILQSLNLRVHGPDIISCPTCGRMEVDIAPIVKKVEQRTSNLCENIKIAIMGCIVNGPGEARIADIGIACGKGAAILFKKGKIVKKVSEKEMLKTFLDEIDTLVEKSPRKQRKDNKKSRK
ncbi:MAG: flavodoxin-dependent (E)-4-hydroxy-3-methylbut-2-enyl-diphosphate synthase [Candidatus Cloacimonadota bacterium]|nr:MAG: flavodoxin-dependent (E)-4-hydroxy-3-methylbut-2-enyl-diphosphate synthase [Candidatus Cloacimonadota bacterium]